MAIDTLVLGAGQEVGKSCVVVTINGKRIMFDCGMHMSYNDHRQYPDFSLIGPNFDQSISCVIITHCHLDHVGALPYFTQVCGYSGPIYMTHPTKALSPIMLEDYRKMVDRRGGEEQFTLEHIEQCMKKVTTVDVKQTVQVDKDLQIRPYYAGHVLGAAMFYAKVGDASMVYTGDYNMTSDRHLGAAQIERLNLDLVITESTYATTIRDSRFSREREFLEAVSTCVTGGGKVLIPAFALGRTQELCILLEDYWERMNLKVPIYISSGLTLEANLYYKLYISWTSQKIKETYSTRNAFDFKHVHEFERSMIDAPGPCVLFATPGMLGGGFSVEVFKHWAPSDKNLVIMSGYCLPGTLGHKLTSGKDTLVDVRCKIHQLAFSPHTDAKGIMDLLKFLSPKHAILVHGEKPKMAKLKGRIESELGIPCHCPANNECVSVPSTDYETAVASDAFIRSCSNPNFKFSISSSEDVHGSNSRNINSLPRLRVSDDRVAEGILIVDKNKKAKVVHQDELPLMLGKQKHQVKFAYCCPVDIINLQESEETKRTCQSMSKNELLRLLSAKLSTELSEVNIQDFGDHLQVGTSLHVSICLKESCPYRLSNDVEEKSEAVYFCCSWGTEDEKLPWKIISMLQKRNKQDYLC